DEDDDSVDIGEPLSLGVNAPKVGVSLENDTLIADELLDAIRTEANDFVRVRVYAVCRIETASFVDVLEFVTRHDQNGANRGKHECTRLRERELHGIVVELLDLREGPVG